MQKNVQYSESNWDGFESQDINKNFYLCYYFDMNSGESEWPLNFFSVRASMIAYSSTSGGLFNSNFAAL